MTEEHMVSLSDKTADVRLLIHLAYPGDLPFHRNVLGPHVGLGVVIDDIIALGKLLFPKNQFWWFEKPGLNRILVPPVIRQYPVLVSGEVAPCVKLDEGNLDEWVGKVAGVLGGRNLHIRAADATMAA